MAHDTQSEVKSKCTVCGRGLFSTGVCSRCQQEALFQAEIAEQCKPDAREPHLLQMGKDWEEYIQSHDVPVTDFGEIELPDGYESWYDYDGYDGLGKSGN